MFIVLFTYVLNVSDTTITPKNTNMKTENIFTPNVKNWDIKDRVDFASKWVEEFITINREILINEGLTPKTIHNLYCKTQRWPMGVKSFAPILHLAGLTKLLRKRIVVYVLNTLTK